MRWSALVRIVLIVLAVGIFSCKKDKQAEAYNEQDFKYEYFPDNKGHYVIYQVDSSVKSSFDHKITNYHYQVKEIIESKYADASNRPTQRVERYYRKTASDSWSLLHVISANRTTNSAERVEENQRIVKIKFPVKKGTRWNANVYNTLGELFYEITGADEATTINGKAYDKTLTITQQNDSNLVFRKSYKEVYAYGVGLVYKEIIDLNYKIPPDTSIIKDGVTCKYNLIEYGN